MSYLPFIKETITHAGEIARGFYGNVSSEVKLEDNNQVLTEADIAIGKYIVEQIQNAYPEHNIIDEEAGVIDNGSNITWVVDPIDGTSNFAAGSPLYGCMMGVLVDNEPFAGGIALPSFHEVYLAEMGKGATRNGEKIRVNNSRSLEEMLVSYGIDGHRNDPERTRTEAKILGEIILAIRNLRTSHSVYDFMMTASGVYGAAIVQTSKVWDNVAQEIIIKEAGGMYTDLLGSPLNYKNVLKRIMENYTVCSGSLVAYNALQGIIHSQRGESCE